MKEIKMIPVKSSQIKSVGYDAEANVLYLEFTNGVVYLYSSVPVKVYETLLIPTMSVGKYFYQEIKGKFEYKRTIYNVLLGKLQEPKEENQ